MTPHSFVAAVSLVAAPFIGSFLGTLILRMSDVQPVSFWRSSCPHCAHLLGPLELVPLVSWLVQRGRCRHCGAMLGSFYPMVELAALAVAFSVVVMMEAAPPWLLLASVALGWTLLALAWIDAREQLLPDALTLPLIPAGLLVSWLVEPASLADHLFGAAAGVAAFWLMALLYRRLRGRAGLGGGDIKLASAAGAWVAWQGLPSVILVASLTGAIFAAARFLSGERPTGAALVPFGPFLALGLWLVWLVGPFDIG